MHYEMHPPISERWIANEVVTLNHVSNNVVKSSWIHHLMAREIVTSDIDEYVW